MNQIFDSIDGVVTAISGVLYKPYIVPLFLLAAGLIFTFRSKFIQIRMLGESFRVVKEKPKTKGSVSSFGALMISTASRVGTGNIVGVSTAICLGGYGAVFWMWVTAILGGASAFVESTLAQIQGRHQLRRPLLLYGKRPAESVAGCDLCRDHHSDLCRGLQYAGLL